MKVSAPVRDTASIATFEGLDEQLRAWALAAGGEERQYPSLIDDELLSRAGYPEAFPHLLMTAAVSADPAGALAAGNTILSGWSLSPAVCYHAFAELAGRVVEDGIAVTARGTCFRHEDREALLPGRRQVEFEMRELILAGSPSWIDERLTAVQPVVTQLAESRGLEVAWCPASDPFFLPRAQGKAHMQRLLGTKLELCLPCGLAVASINRHGTHLTERFEIRMTDGSFAHSACVAFGLDRWAAYVPSL